MIQDFVQLYPIIRIISQAQLDQITAIVGDKTAILWRGSTNFVVLLEGDVALDHVEQEDAQGPDCVGVRSVL